MFGERTAGRAKEDTEGEKWEGQEAAAVQTADKQQLWQGLCQLLFHCSGRLQLHHREGTRRGKTDRQNSVGNPQFSPILPSRL